MIVEEIGIYKLMGDFTVRGTSTIFMLTVGQRIVVSQVDKQCSKILSDSFPDWVYWDIPVEPVIKEENLIE